MKFSLIVTMGRPDASQSMESVAADALELVQIADAGGFDIVWPIGARIPNVSVWVPLFWPRPTGARSVWPGNPRCATC